MPRGISETQTWSGRLLLAPRGERAQMLLNISWSTGQLTPVTIPVPRHNKRGVLTHRQSQGWKTASEDWSGNRLTGSDARDWQTKKKKKDWKRVIPSLFKQWRTASDNWDFTCVYTLSRVRLFWPHELQPARLLCPWDSPGKHTEVGCHFLLQGNLPHPGIILRSPALAGGFFTTEPAGKLLQVCVLVFYLFWIATFHVFLRDRKYPGCWHPHTI